MEICEVIMFEAWEKMYTVLHMFTQVLFWAGSQGNHQNFDPFFLPKKLTDFHGDEAKKIFFFLKKHQCGSTYMVVRLT